MFGDVNFLRPWYGDYFVKDQKLLNIDNCSEYSFWDWDWNWESIALDEVISIKPLSRLKLRFDNNAIYKGDLIWEIKDEDVAKKLNIKLGEKDTVLKSTFHKVLIYIPLQRYQGAWYLCCFTLVPFTKKHGTFHEMYHGKHGTFLLEVISFDLMYHAEVVSFRQMYHAEVVSFAL